MTCADTQEGVLLLDQWYPLPNGCQVYLLQSSLYHYRYQGRTPNKRLPMSYKRMFATHHNINYPKCEAKNWWPSVDTPLTLILRIGRWPYWDHFCQSKLLIRQICRTLTKALFNYRTYKTTNRWPSVDADFTVLSSQYLLPTTIAFFMIGTYW
jgi:hypothetical protein